MDRVYEALVHWADAIIVATPIRWGAASSLYFKMAERLNCVQNAVTIRNQRADPQQGRGLHHRRRPGQHPGRGRTDARLLRRARLHLPAVSLHRALARLVARGHGAKRRGRARLRKELAEGADMLVKRCLDLAGQLVARDEAPTSIERGGRKAHDLRMAMRPPAGSRPSGAAKLLVFAGAGAARRRPLRPLAR